MLKKFLLFSYGSWIAAAISLFTTPIITAIIIPAEFGKATIYTLAYTIILQIVLLGGDQAFARMFYENRNADRPNLLWNSLLPVICAVFIVDIFLLLSWKYVSLWILGKTTLFIVILLCINILIGSIERFAFMVVRMEQKGHVFSILRIISALFSFAIVVSFAIYFKPSFLAIIAGNILSLFLSVLILILSEKRFWFNKIKLSKQLIIKLVRFGLPFIPVFLMSMLFESMDKLFLREYSDFEQLGIYSATFKIVSILTIVQTGFSMFWTPLSYLHYQEKPHDKAFFEDVFRFLSFILILSALLLIGIKDILIYLVHENYRSGASIVPFLLFIPVMYTLTEVTTVGINFLNKTTWYLFIFIFMLVISALLNYYLVPILGIKGAALSVALSYSIYFSFRTFFSVRLYPMNFEIYKTITMILILFIVCGINTFVDNFLMGIFSTILGVFFLCIINRRVIKDLYLQGNQIFFKFLYMKGKIQK